jgi:hypothetical protein
MFPFRCFPSTTIPPAIILLISQLIEFGHDWEMHHELSRGRAPDHSQVGSVPHSSRFWPQASSSLPLSGLVAYKKYSAVSTFLRGQHISHSLQFCSMTSSRSISMRSLGHGEEYDPLPGSFRQIHDAHEERLLNNRFAGSSEGHESTAMKDQTTVQQHYKPPERSESFHLQDWQWEFTAAVFSLLCVVAIIIVLKVYQERSLSSWHFVHNITLNTVVALLSTLSRTALIVPVASCLSQLKWIHLVRSPRPLWEMQTFDDASRGPWGSLELIWRLHVTTKLATWGSLITILSLTMGPLSQQLLSYPSRLHFDTSGATFYKNQVYDSGASRGVTGAGYLSKLASLIHWRRFQS